MRISSGGVRTRTLAAGLLVVATLSAGPVAAQAPRTAAADKADKQGTGERPADPRWSYERPDEETLQYAAPDARIEPLPLQVQRLRRENQDIRAQIGALEDRVRSLIGAVNTLTGALTTAQRR